MDDDASPLGGTEVHSLTSKSVGDAFKIFVGRCGTDGVAAPVLYLTDANGAFGGAVDLVRSMQLARHLPPLLVVGIGYHVETLADAVEIRTRDLTPTAWPAYARFEPDRTRMGGAPRFLAFIRDELMPWVGDRFGGANDSATYFGHSLGGLFGAYALLEEPDTFAHYAIGSPSLWWHNWGIFERETDYAVVHDDLQAKVFFGIGADETHEGRVREAANLDAVEQQKAAAIHLDMVDDMRRFVAQLQQRNYPSLRIRSEVFPDEFHITVPFLNLARGLRWLFDAPR